MTTEERREYERKRWHRRYADPEFRKRESERSKKRMAEYLADDMNREHYKATRRKWYRKNREKLIAKNKAYRERRRAQEIYPLEPIKSTDEWQKIEKVVKKAQDQFLRIEPGEISPAAKAILAHDYTPEGRATKQLMESLDSEEHHEQ